MTVQRKKILFFVESLAGGGAEKVLSVLAPHLSEAGFDVTVFSVVNTGVHAETVKGKVQYRYFLEDPSGALSFIARLKYRMKYHLIHLLPATWVHRWMIRDVFDVEVAFIEGLATKIIAASNNNKAKKIAWVHLDLAAQHWTRSIFKTLRRERECYKQFDRIVCVSENVKRSFESLFNIKQNITVLYNPVDRERIIEESKKPVDLPSKTNIRLCSVGRLAEQKGYDRLLRVHKRLLEEGIAHELWILGEGPERPRLESYIEQNRLGESVRLLGFKPDPYSWMGQCDLFVCSSRAEGFSTAVTEALILGMPVITTDCSGMKELLGDHGEYAIVTENSEEAFYAGLRSLLIAPKQLDHYRRQSVLRGHEFGLEKTLPAIERLLAGEM